MSFQCACAYFDIQLLVCIKNIGKSLNLFVRFIFRQFFYNICSIVLNCFFFMILNLTYVAFEAPCTRVEPDCDEYLIQR